MIEKQNPHGFNILLAPTSEKINVQRFGDLTGQTMMEDTLNAQVKY